MFKKIMMLFLAVMVCTMSACTTNESEEEKTPEENTNETVETNNENSEDGNSLVVYFSYSGNTEVIANWVAESSASDIFELIPSIAYPTDYNECVDLASEEQADNARPQFEGQVENMDEYSTIYLGYPCWWGDAPMIVYTFLDSYDFEGKTIVPFTTHGGSGFGSSISNIKSAASNANVVDDGLAIRDSNIDSSQSSVNEWAQSFK